MSQSAEKSRLFYQRTNSEKIGYCNTVVVPATEYGTEVYTYNQAINRWLSEYEHLHNF